ncbi:hypothetical protein ABZ078_08525 [Streptomyces sp. NPDC006385]|uniref:hypothetical protein n=1 Tax=Streptomyces sp. NPDC006385 TaxID=3156761 RepID=UPI0033BB736C
MSGPRRPAAGSRPRRGWRGPLWRPGLPGLDVIGIVAAVLPGIDVSGTRKPFDPGADDSDVTPALDRLPVGIAGGLVVLSATPLYLPRAAVSAGLRLVVDLAAPMVAAYR